MALVRLLWVVAVLVLLGVAVFVVNQTAQVVALANTVSPAVGRVTLIALLLIYASAVLVPAVVFFRLPRAPRPPADERSPAFEAYLGRLRARLAYHPALAGHPLPAGDRAAVDAALRILDAQADALIRSAATTVFLTTAVSQNGRLDALLVLAAQSRLVWRLAHHYLQRPALGELVRLYANVAATVFLVTELEDLDIEHQVEPVIASALAGSAASLVPGASMVATLVTQSILDGAANAFLTLRIGVLCSRYCGSPIAVDRRGARRAASMAAARMLAPVVQESAGIVSRAVLRAARRAGSGTVGALTGGMLRRGGGRPSAPGGP